VKNADTKVQSTGEIVVRATSTGAKVFDLGGGITDVQLDNMATATEDDPATPLMDERAVDLAAEKLLLTSLDDQFRAQGHAFAFGYRYTSADGTQSLKKGDVVRIATGYGGGGTVGACSLASCGRSSRAATST
jgi:hypothetical protein